MNIKLEEVTKCPICTKNDCIDKYSKVYDYLNRDFQREYELSSCRECRHSFLSKRPIEEEIYKFYEKHYYTHENKKKLFKLDYIKSSVLFLTKLPYKFIYSAFYSEIKNISKGSILDVGCGNGEYILKMKKKGWETYGIETDPEALEICKRKIPNGNFSNQKLNNFSFEGKKFDLIYMSHVLEHVYDPLKYLQICSNLLKKDGKVLIKVPNYGSLEQKIFGKYWRGFEPPRHINNFSFNSLKIIISKTDLKLIGLAPDPLPMCTLESLTAFLENFVPKFYIRYFQLPFYLLFYLINIFLGYFKIFNSMKVLITKNV